MAETSKMKIEIWSDIMCPFCYIGKRRFEQALEQFPHSDLLDIEWKSYQLMPDLITDPDKGLQQMLSESKGISLSQAKQMNDYVREMAAEVGLTYNLDSSIPANTFKAHRFIHLAKREGKQVQAEEALFKAYFTDSKNIDDDVTLLEIGKQLGIQENVIQELLSTELFSEDVNQDLYEARQIGVTGVPFFVFDNRKAISGAQPTALFLDTIRQTFEEWELHK